MHSLRNFANYYIRKAHSAPDTTVVNRQEFSPQFLNKMSNHTYIDRIVNRKPFGWTYTDPKTVFHFSFEEIDPYWWHDLAVDNPFVPLYAGTAYIIVVFGIKHVLRDKEPFDLRMPLFWWNTVLGVFSIVGLIRFLPGFLYVLQQPNGFYNSICVKKDTNIPMGFWLLAFVLSKFVELGDTVFIVLRKRPLVLLQWYHHLLTMGVVWSLCNSQYYLYFCTMIWLLI